MSLFKKTCLFKNRSPVRRELLRQWRVVTFKKVETFRTPSETQGDRSHPWKHQFSITLHTVTALVWNLSYIYHLLISVSPSPFLLRFFLSLSPSTFPTPSPQFLSLSKFAKSSSVSLPCFYSPPFLHYFEWDSCENRKCSGLSITSSLYPLPPQPPPPFQTT